MPGPLTLVIEQRITDGPAWHFRFADGAVRVHAGSDVDADVWLTSDEATAEAIQSGQLSAQRAFLDGVLQIGGDMTLLLTHRRALAAIGELMTPAT